MSSTDGYCTLITFEDGELGQPYKDQVVYVKTKEEVAAEVEAKNQEKVLKARSKSEDKTRDKSFHSGKEDIKVYNSRKVMKMFVLGKTCLKYGTSVLIFGCCI